MAGTTSVYAGIIKMDENADGTLTVYGKATDDSVDIDQQICDAAWLDKAMPEWFMTGGNIREQHSSIAAGVAQEYEQKKDGHYISALVVDPVSVKKVKNRVLRGFSIGIKSPRVVRDQKAANGRIIDGQIVEVSLVDRPANPSCQLVLAKSVNGEKTLHKTEELIENYDGELSTKEPVMGKSKKADNSALVKEADGMPINGEAKSVPSRDEMSERYAAARKALDDITAMCKEYGYSDIEKQYGETAEEETAEGPSVSAETAQEEVEETTGDKPLDKELVDDNNNEIEKSTDKKCLECGCNMPGSNHGVTQISTPQSGGNPAVVSNVSTAEIVTEKSAPVTEIIPNPTVEVLPTVTEETIKEFVEDDSASKTLLADGSIEALIEKAVKSAMKSVEAEVAELKSAKEAVENKALELESELATAKSLAVGGGPKRTTIATGAKTNSELKAKADMYFAKALATTDNDLAKGYRAMANDFLAKAATEN